MAVEPRGGGGLSGAVLERVRRGDARRGDARRGDARVLPPGQEVTLSWSPATDTLRHGVISGFSASSESVFSLYDPNLTMEGSTIRFVAPANARQAARAEIEGSYVPPILRCEGAVACSASNEYCSKFAVR